MTVVRNASLRSILFVFVAMLALAVTGCSGDSVPPASRAGGSASSPSPSSWPSPSPTATDPATAEIDTIIVRPAGLDLMADGEAVRTLAYTDAAHTFIAGLTAAIGVAPVTEFVPSTDFRVDDETDYRWDGLLVVEDHPKNGGPGPEPVGEPTLFVLVGKAMVGGKIPVATHQGFQAGDSTASVAHALGVDPASTAFFARPAETGPRLGPSRVEGEENAAAVLVGESMDPSIIEIRAPYNFGDGHDL